ncbi:MAG: hypothetical protein RMJ88_11025 [Thermogemmata sp.]|nr:hypothetical protein [Thermogemmata sp.]
MKFEWGGQLLMEARCSNMQTVVASCLHPTGSTYRWYRVTPPPFSVSQVTPATPALGVWVDRYRSELPGMLEEVAKGYCCYRGQVSGPAVVVGAALSGLRLP